MNPSFPIFIAASFWLQRNSPAWQFGIGETVKNSEIL
jgi:hypothetical protein